MGTPDSQFRIVRFAGRAARGVAVLVHVPAAAARERRRYARFARRGHVTIFLCQSGGLSGGIRARFRDASARGIGLGLPLAIQVGEQFLLRVSAADRAEAEVEVALLYTVVRCRRMTADEFDVGAELAHVIGRRPDGAATSSRRTSTAPAAARTSA